MDSALCWIVGIHLIHSKLQIAQGTDNGDTVDTNGNIIAGFQQIYKREQRRKGENQSSIIKAIKTAFIDNI